MNEPIDATAREAVPANGPQLPAQAPAMDLEQAQRRATAVADVIRKRNLFKRIGAKDYVMVEGWSTLAAQYGLVASIAWSRPLDSGGFEAEAELRRVDNGTVVAHAQAECGTAGDGDWADRAAYAQRSMAETRAASKVCRIALSWVMVLAGYSPTPAEEVPSGGFDDRPARPAPPRPQREGPIQMKSRKEGTCAECGQPISAGVQIFWDGKRAWHVPCDPTRRAEESAPAEEQPPLGAYDGP